MSLSGVLDKSRFYLPGSAVSNIIATANPNPQQLVVSTALVDDELKAGVLTLMPSVGPRMPNTSCGSWMSTVSSIDPVTGLGVYSASQWAMDVGPGAAAQFFAYGFSFEWVPGIAPPSAAVAGTYTPTDFGANTLYSNWGWRKVALTNPALSRYWPPSYAVSPSFPPQFDCIVFVNPTSVLKGAYTSWYANSLATFGGFPAISALTTVDGGPSSGVLTGTPSWPMLVLVNGLSFWLRSSNAYALVPPANELAIITWTAIGDGNLMYGATVTPGGT